MRLVSRIGVLAIVSQLWLTLCLRAADQDKVKQSIDAGVAALKAKQKDNGFWIYGSDNSPSHNSIGATALAGLALLECGVPADDEAIQRAAQAARISSIDLTHTYSLSLCILFLDRLGDKEDDPFIKKMTTRLVAGQQRDGCWAYYCPPSPAEDRKELTTTLKTRADSTSSIKKEKKEPDPKRATELSRAIEKQLLVIASIPKVEPDPEIGFGDNSNTQFALIALWVARRHDLPDALHESVDKSLAVVDLHFRTTQNLDGGWPYKTGYFGRPTMSASSAAMTCAGLLGLAVGNVSNRASSALRTKADKKSKNKEKTDDRDNADTKKDQAQKSHKDLGKDERVVAGLKYLGAVLAGKISFRRNPGMPVPRDQVRGEVADPNYYYFLWSLERVAVTYGFDSLGNINWFDYGAGPLLRLQSRDGSWSDDLYGGSNTSFALLFLSRSNLVRDLTTALKGSVQDPAKPSLKSGSGVDGSKSEKKPASEVTQQPAIPKAGEAPSEPAAKPEPAPRTTSQAAQLGKDLVDAPAGRKEELLDQFRQAKGSEYTDSLAKAIHQLDGDNKKKARQALADRLSDATSATLGDKLGDANLELRRAAAIACAMKEDKTHIPRLIDLLEDPESAVNRAAYAALKSLTNQDFGPAKSAGPEEIVKAVTAWKTWWKENQGK